MHEAAGLEILMILIFPSCLAFTFSFFPSFLLLGEGKLAKKDFSLSFNLQQVHVKWCCVGEGLAGLKWEVAVKAKKLNIYITKQL